MPLDNLIKSLKIKGVLRSENIENALRAIDRANFVPENKKEYAYYDEPIHIGHGQTISQPYTVVFMLELLQPQENDIILDAGYGSGWVTAILAYIVGTKGKIHAFEIVKDLCKFGKENVSKYEDLIPRVNFYCESAQNGVPISSEDTILDKITAGANLNQIPEKWKQQLKTEGIMVFPKDRGIYKLTKNTTNEYREEFFPGFAFVPFIQT